MIEFENEEEKEDCLIRLAFRLHLTRDLMEYRKLKEIFEELEPDDQKRFQEYYKDILNLDALVWGIRSKKLHNLQKGN